MTWTKISDDHFDRIEVIGLSRSASLLYIEALNWCNRVLTDGALPRAALRRCTSSTDPDGDADALVKAGLWEVTEDGWQMDWSDQRTAAVVLAERAENKKRQNDYRERGRRHARGDHSMCTDKCPKRRNGVTNVVGNGHPSPDPSRPVPTDREGSRGIGNSADDGSTPGTASRPSRPSPTARTAKGKPIAASEFTIPGEGSTLPCDVAVSTYEAEDEHIAIYVMPSYPDAAAAELLRRLSGALDEDLTIAKGMHRCPRTKGNHEVCEIDLSYANVADGEVRRRQPIELELSVPAEFAHAWIDRITWELSYGLASEVTSTHD